MFRMLLAVFFVLAAFRGNSLAREIRDPHSFAVGENGLGTNVHVYATFHASNGCARFTGKRNGPPDGRPVSDRIVSGVIQVTFTIDNSGRNCGAPRLIRDLFVVGSDVTNYQVQIFFVSTEGRLLKEEITAIRG